MATTVKKAKAGVKNAYSNMLKKAPAKLEARDSVAPQQLELAGDEQVAVRLPSELVQRMRDAAYYTPGETLTGLVKRGVTAEIDRLERARGEAFPRANAPVRKGRPVRRE
ncbi:MAG: hypothetical protein E6Q97_02065 [Desulfurellales bacterium]|nr:MAG: hypothetical protein E6Q97_02065 [Desulfurellales bacterium]